MINYHLTEGNFIGVLLLRVDLDELLSGHLFNRGTTLSISGGRVGSLVRLETFNLIPVIVLVDFFVDILFFLVAEVQVPVVGVALQRAVMKASTAALELRGAPRKSPLTPCGHHGSGRFRRPTI